jgi:hypothetical protein
MQHSEGIIDWFGAGCGMIGLATIYLTPVLLLVLSGVFFFQWFRKKPLPWRCAKAFLVLLAFGLCASLLGD